MVTTGAAEAYHSFKEKRTEEEETMACLLAGVWANTTGKESVRQGKTYQELGLQTT